jgi:hypothetical protein
MSAIAKHLNSEEEYLKEERTGLNKNFKTLNVISQ